MPTATEFFGYSAHNLGPLTTTFTAPSSCATNTNNILYVNATSPYIPLALVSSCSAEVFSECYPSGKEWFTYSAETTGFVQGVYKYFSPGIACPDGWKTVATMKHGSKTGQVDVSGALTDSILYTYDGAKTLEVTDFWRNILDKSETLAFCCPSGYAGDVYGFCKSTIGPLKPTRSNEPDPSYCAIYAEYAETIDRWISTNVEGVTRTEGLMSALPVSVDTSTTTLFLGEWGVDYLEDYAYATWVPAVTLISKGEDEEKSESENKSDEDDESAASSVRRGGVVSVLGVTVGFLAGVGMLMNW